MSKKINTWEIAEAIHDAIKDDHGSIFEDASYDWDTTDGSDNEFAELDIWLNGDIEHPLSGWQDVYNTAIGVSGQGKITSNGKITFKGTYKMECGTATYIEELEELRKLGTPDISEEKSFEWTSDNASDFVTGLSEIPQ